MDNDWRIPDEDLDDHLSLREIIPGAIIGGLVWAVIGLSIWWIFRG